METVANSESLRVSRVAKLASAGRDGGLARFQENSGPKNAKVPKRSGGNGPTDMSYYPPKITK